MKKKINISKILVVAIFLNFNFVVAQQELDEVDYNNIIYKHERLISKKDTIDFVFASQKGNVKTKKTIFFIQGSGTIPIMSNSPEGANYLIPPFNLDKVLKDFNFVIISKPGIPIIVDKKDLNEHSELKITPFTYTLQNNLFDLSRRAIKIINLFYKKKNEIYLVGHSQGARVAAYVTYKMGKKIKKSAFMSINIKNRFDEELNNLRIEQIKNKIDNDVITKKINKIEKDYRDLKSDQKDNVKRFRGVDGDTYYSYASFTFPYFNYYLENIKIPELFVYGSADYGGTSENDKAKLENEKSNLEFKVYEGLNHNFENKRGDTETEYYWQNVFEDVVTWLKKG
jgi:hypothetical protein